MNNKFRKTLSVLLMIISIILIILGFASEIYWISIAGLAVILLMLFLRSLYIRKLNKQIKDINQQVNNETEHPQDQ